MDISTENKEIVKSKQASSGESRKVLDEKSPKGKKAKKDEEAPIESIMQDVIENIKSETQQIKAKQEEESKFAEAGDSIEQSIWSPYNRICKGDRTFRAKAPAFKVPGDSPEERTKNMEGMLNKDKHIKLVQEVFSNGNSWIEIEFDCEFGREEAIKRIQKKEGDWLRLIPVTDDKPRIPQLKSRNQENRTREKKTFNQKTKDNNDKRLFQKVEENSYPNEGHQNRNSDSTRKYNHNRRINMDCITIWDLPEDINSKEVRYMCKKLGDIEDMYIKRKGGRALAVVEFSEVVENKDIPWVLPIGDGRLARVSTGKEDHEERDRRHKFVAKLTGITEGLSETLLLRHLKDRKAKAVYIPKRRSGYMKQIAKVTFANKKEMEEAKRKLVRYNNLTLYWSRPRQNEDNLSEDMSKEEKKADNRKKWVKEASDEESNLSRRKKE